MVKKSFIMALFAVVVCFVSATVFSSCTNEDEIDDVSRITSSKVIKHDSTTVNTKSVGSGIDLKPDNTWTTVDQSGDKIRVFKKGSNTYVIAVDLSKGAKVVPYYEFASGHGNATSSNPDPRFKKLQLSSFNMSSLGWFAVTNLGFFGDRTPSSGEGYSYTNDHSTFLLKKNNTLVTCGYGTYSSSEKPRRWLVISGSTAMITGDHSDYANCTSPNSGWASNLYSRAKSEYSPYQNVVMGFHPLDKNKNKNSRIGRTFVGVRQKTPLTNGGPAYVYILVSSSMTQQEAYNTLIDFSCHSSEIIMFDGSGSTRMKTASGIVLSPSDSRSVPTWLVVKEN